MRINILTIFPEYFNEVLNLSILKRAQDKDLVDYRILNLRDFASDKHQTTDQRPFAGGPGMVMMIEPIDKALEYLRVKKGNTDELIILTSAKGASFTQSLAKNYSKLKQLTIICGHYEGVDQRVVDHLIDLELRIGDYVLTGGEPAALVMTDAIVRLLPGVLGNEDSNLGESHSKPGYFADANYTRPASYKEWRVPEVLLSGDPKKIEDYRASLRQSPGE